MLTIVLLSAALLSIGINLLAAKLISGIPNYPYIKPKLNSPEPKVAILIACRNEEQTIEACLEALKKLEYPSEKLKILIGNDDSDDGTWPLLQKLADCNAQLQVFDIVESWGSARGKANVLAHLARKVEGWADYLFITDADVRPNPDWVMGLVTQFEPRKALISGITLPQGRGLSASAQRLDWLLAQAWAQAYNLLPRVGRPLTALGNNMAVRAEAYFRLGGYETIPFSVTEDFELKEQLERVGYRSGQVINPHCFAATLPVASWLELLQQRHRWLMGARQLPLPMVLVLVVQALWFPALVVLFIISWPLALGALVVKWIGQYQLARQLKNMSRNSEPLPFFAIYEVYSGLLNICTLLYYLLPIPVKWKNRAYRRSRVSLS